MVEKLREYARMSFKPAKFRSLVLKRGKVDDTLPFNNRWITIPTITEKQVKSKVFDSTLRNTTSVRSTCIHLENWL